MRLRDCMLEYEQAIDDFQLVIPVAEIVSANLFDPVVYERFAGLPDKAAE